MPALALPASSRSASLVGLFVALAALSACTESASISLDWTSTAKPGRNLSIDNVAGSVRLTKGPAASAVTGHVRVTAAGFDKKQEARDAALAVRIEERGTADDLALVVTVPPGSGKTYDVDLDLVVPDGVAVNVVTDNGSVHVDSLPVIKLDTTNGDIELRFTSGPAALVTNDYPILVESHQGDLDVRTSNAPIDLVSVAGNINARTTNGAITARVTPPVAGEIFLATTNAPVDLTVPTSYGARLLAVTSGPGAVFVDNLPFRPEGSYPGQAEGTIGSGAGLLDVRTSNADIAIRGR